MALIQTSLIWVAYAVAIAILLIIAALFVFIYQDPRERAASVTTVCIFTTLCLLATVLLMPVDIALVSATNSSKLGRKKDWATPDKVESILYTLEIVYYCLYSLDALLCLLVIPFTYFWYEEREDEEGERTFGQKFWGATKYTIFFLLVVVILFVVGFFVPFAKGIKDDKDNKNLDYFKKLLLENRELCAFKSWISVLT
jgi:LMBR1 domain-containing protein 1